MADVTSTRQELDALGERIRQDYTQTRRVMSFAEYLDLVTSRPHEQLRSAPQYLKDCFDHFGTVEVERPWGKVRRFRLFDCPWADGRDKLIGQEDVQNRVYRAVRNFVSEGATNKLVLLHGPNGSAKSTFVRCLGRAMQYYSTLDVGALYRINWIFPSQKIAKTGIGFSGRDYAENAGDTYAYLPDELIDAKLHDELRDHPLLLLPPEERAAFIERILQASGRDKDFVVSDYIGQGRLSHKNRTIYEALLVNHHGDFLKVLRHVQIERFYVEHRYREGYVTVEPQLAVDASERQITADRSIASLPVALQSVSLYEYGGQLVNANRGLIEYSDLLKRPLEAYKYLLTTVEQASVGMQSATLFFDLVFIGSSNEIHLSAFKEIPEWQSFKGRLELVRVPYLLDFFQEQQIYADKLREAAATRHVAPHCAYVAALWAVLTRMRKPMADRFPKEVSDLIARLTPLEKAELYALGKAPEALTGEQAKQLLASLRLLWRESDSYPNYEGRTGASPREMQAILFNAADSPSYGYVSPLAILDEIEELTRQTSVYEFLKQDALPGGFHDHRKFIELVRGRLIEFTDEEVRSCLGMVEEAEYSRLFERYVSHVMHWTKHEKVRNPTTGQLENPDENMMRDVERTLEVSGRPDDFRHDLIAKIGAWSLDHPGQKPDYSRIFESYVIKLRRAYYEEQRKAVRRSILALLDHLTGNEARLSAEEQRRAERSIGELIRRHGYSRESARDAIQLLVRTRYAS
jgi:predicted Ser/Thr protein kinase